jgi:hypothetical protein
LSCAPDMHAVAGFAWHRKEPARDALCRLSARWCVCNLVASTRLTDAGRVSDGPFWHPRRRHHCVDLQTRQFELLGRIDISMTIRRSANILIYPSCRARATRAWRLAPSGPAPGHRYNASETRGQGHPRWAPQTQWKRADRGAFWSGPSSRRSKRANSSSRIVDHLSSAPCA